jgi:hypothetical protein
MKTIKAAGLLAVVSGAVVAAIACSEHTEPVESVERPVSQLRQSLVDVPSNNGVSALAGTGVRGALDASNALSGTFNDPAGVSIATDGTVYVAEWGNNSIRRIQTSGALDTAILGNPNLLTNPRCEEAGTHIRLRREGIHRRRNQRDITDCRPGCLQLHHLGKSWGSRAERRGSTHRQWFRRNGHRGAKPIESDSGVDIDSSKSEWRMA